MADALCGPSNALQNFQKHSSVDRTLQQDRILSRQSPTQGFRSQNQNDGALDPEFNAFEAGLHGAPLSDIQHPASFLPPAAHGPVLNHIHNPGWASDFQNLQISGPSQHVSQQQFRPESSASGWQNDFMRQAHPKPQSQTPATQTSQMPLRYGPVMGVMGFGGMSSHHSVYQDPYQSHVQEHKEQFVFDESAFEAAFAEARAEVELQEQKSQEEGTTEPLEIQQTIRIGSDTIRPPVEGTNESDELAKTAGQLLDSVSHDQSQKFKESNFLALMRQLRDREVVVDGDEFLPTAQPLHPGGQYYPEQKRAQETDTGAAPILNTIDSGTSKLSDLEQPTTPYPKSRVPYEMPDSYQPFYCRYCSYIHGCLICFCDWMLLVASLNTSAALLVEPQLAPVNCQLLPHHQTTINQLSATTTATPLPPPSHITIRIPILSTRRVLIYSIAIHYTYPPCPHIVTHSPFRSSNPYRPNLVSFRDLCACLSFHISVPDSHYPCHRHPTAPIPLRIAKANSRYKRQPCSPNTALPSHSDRTTTTVESPDDSYTVPPPPHSPGCASSSNSPFPFPSPSPPPFSSLYSVQDEELGYIQTSITESRFPCLPAFAPTPPFEESLTSPLPIHPPVVLDTKAQLSRDKTGEASASGKGLDDGEPPPPYTEGSSPLQSFTYVMAGPGGAASIITQVQQTGGGPISTLGDVGGDDHITLDLRGTRFTLSRDELLTLPEFVLLSLFPNGLLPDGHMGTFHEGDVYPVDYDPASLQYMLDFFRTVAQSIPSATPSPTASADGDYSMDPMHGSTRDMLQGRAGIIVLREDLDFYAIPPVTDIDHAEMIEVKRAAGRVLLKQDGIFSGLRKSDEPGSTEQHLIEMLTAGGFNHDDRWGHRAGEPNKAVICSLALAKLRTDMRGDLSGNNVVGMAQKLLLFWRKPARRCWWEGVELEGVE
ncbi:hypothetical protein PAAG_12400 [Paracoccidioides lutzii Pb01]|uniref:Uncharacterized protein n=1 Tax=Paracoccidioides lutzii (strain ATCC MYA-826 / Pb01) TaxID=502779 RepID=A0A0A2VJ38_PARBA|nr:hypothetical protein PAAG_12400 [Paracoccidioides lutzii Pb01]KGQ00929.1 hypothetical protein PAAG_12400 [Paracoccidioides lutzii Pb01]